MSEDFKTEEQIKAEQEANEKLEADKAAHDAAYKQAEDEAACKDKAYSEAPHVDVHEGDLHEGIAQLDMAHAALAQHSATNVGGSTMDIAYKHLEAAIVKLKGIVPKKDAEKKDEYPA